MAQMKDFTSAIAGARQNNSRNNKQYTEEEKAEAQATLTTQGKCGMKAHRRNMIFTTDNMDFVSIMAKSTGLSQSEVVNKILDIYKAEHAEEIKTLLEARRSLMSGSEDLLK